MVTQLCIAELIIMHMPSSLPVIVWGVVLQIKHLAAYLQHVLQAEPTAGMHAQPRQQPGLPSVPEIDELAHVCRRLCLRCRANASPM